jgi:hypothetical protein
MTEDNTQNVLISLTNFVHPAYLHVVTPCAHRPDGYQTLRKGPTPLGCRALWYEFVHKVT